MEFYAKLGERLRALRTRAGLSQAALGVKLGRSPSAIDRYEMGQRRISIADLLRLSKIFGVPLEALLEGSIGRGGVARKVRTSSPDRLHAEHLHLLRELDKRLAYPFPEARSLAVREPSHAYGRRRAGPQGRNAPHPFEAALTPTRLRAWARRAGWPGTDGASSRWLTPGWA